MLVRRLSTICTEEGLGAGSKDLTMLAEVAEGDLRSCLNTLQVSLFFLLFELHFISLADWSILFFDHDSLLKGIVKQLIQLLSKLL